MPSAFVFFQCNQTHSEVICTLKSTSFLFSFFLPLEFKLLIPKIVATKLLQGTPGLISYWHSISYFKSGGVPSHGRQ